MPDKDKISRRFLSVILFMLLLALAANVIPVTDIDGIAHPSTMVISEPEKRRMLAAGTPHGPIVIDGDANFLDTVLQEGWPGDGSPENPYIIDGLDIDLGDEVGHCIIISNTRVSFTISNCSLTGAGYFPSWSGYGGTGINLWNVTNGELVNNTCNSNGAVGIRLGNSHFNTAANNTCNSNGADGIRLGESDSNTVVKNTCFNNGERGIYLEDSHQNTVANNTCTSNRYGIYLENSDSNTVSDNTCSRNTDAGICVKSSTSNIVSDNTCNSNERGINFEDSGSNTVISNICNNNWIGIYLNTSHYNIVVDNTCFSNTEHDIHLYESDSNTVSNNITSTVLAVFIFMALLLTGLVGVTATAIVALGPGWKKAHQAWRLEEKKLRETYQTRRLAEEKRTAFEKSYKDDVVVPIRHLLVSWLRRRRSVKHVDVYENLEQDSSDQ